jgi:hypothetical protein
MNYKEYLTEAISIIKKPISNRKKILMQQMKLRHEAYGTYADPQDRKYHWDDRGNKFIEIKKEQQVQQKFAPKIEKKVEKVEKVVSKEKVEPKKEEKVVEPEKEVEKEEEFEDEGEQEEEFEDEGEQEKPQLHYTENQEVENFGDKVTNKVHASNWNEEAKQKIIEENKKRKAFPEDQLLKYLDDLDDAARLTLENKWLQFEDIEDITPLKPNVEYGLSLDFSTLCKKRLIMQATIEEIQKKTGNVLLPDEIIDIRNKMWEKGYVVACGACYVESKRLHMHNIIDKFLKQNPEMEKHKELLLSIDGFEKMRKEMPDMYKKLKYAAKGTHVKFPEKRTRYHGEILNEFKTDASKVNEFNGHGGLRWQSWSDFELPHLIDGMQAIVDMSMVGLAGHAYTKVPEFAEAFGNTGMMINVSMIPKGTGLDEKGNLLFDDREGMPYETAQELRDKFSNTVGTICIGISDDHIKKLLDSDKIDYVIPYHASGLSEKFQHASNMNNWKDYTVFQSEKILDKKAVKERDDFIEKSAKRYEEENKEKVKKNPKILSIKKGFYRGFFTKRFMEEHSPKIEEWKGDTKKYLKLCKERSIEPKFSQFKDHPNYWKLLIDKKQYNNDGKYIEQQPVKPIFSKSKINEMLKDYKGNETLIANDIVNDYLKESKINEGIEYLNYLLGQYTFDTITWIK